MIGAALALPSSGNAEGSYAASGLTSELRVDVTNLRNAKGEVGLCLTRNTQDFLDCEDHPGAIKREAPASNAQHITVRGLTAGEWSLLLLHDENGDGKMQKSLGIPREGFGFSGNPAVRMGPPKADEVAFDLPPGKSVQHVKVKYIL